VPVDDAVVEFARSHIDEETVEPLGEVTALMIRRYARACGDENPLYHDEEFAREHGYPGIIAPPNLLTSIIDWDEGASEDELREDGTAGEAIVGIPQSGVRIMGGGEDMEFHIPAVAGDRVHLRTKLDAVEERETKSGRMAILRYRNTYETEDGRTLMTCMRSILLR
jgi:acyl dehydratase